MNSKSEPNRDWFKVKSEIGRTWPELHSYEIESAKYDLTSLASKLQKNFGYAKEEVQMRINEILKRHF